MPRNLNKLYVQEFDFCTIAFPLLQGERSLWSIFLEKSSARLFFCLFIFTLNTVKTHEFLARFENIRYVSK
jgi:hypothetical protein